MSSPKQFDEARIAELLAEVSREIETIASRAAERMEAEFFAYAKQLRMRAIEGREEDAANDGG